MGGVVDVIEYVVTLNTSKVGKDIGCELASFLDDFFCRCHTIKFEEAQYLKWVFVAGLVGECGEEAGDGVSVCIAKEIVECSVMLLGWSCLNGSLCLNELGEVGNLIFQNFRE